LTLFLGNDKPNRTLTMKEAGAGNMMDLLNWASNNPVLAIIIIILVFGFIEGIIRWRGK